MNRLESLLYNRVKNNPVLKQKIVNLYQGMLSVVPQPKIRTNLPFQERKGYYYGFHDKSPFSPDGKLLLSHKVSIPYRAKQPVDALEVGFFSGTDWTEFVPVGSTTGWNWQMASMLQWHGNRGDKLIYNDLDGNRHVARLRSLDGKLLDTYERPVVHVTPDGHLACCYDFRRAEKAMPGYGIVTNDDRLADEDHSTFCIYDTLNGASVYEISLREAAAIRPHPSMEGAFHFFHHALFNPSGDRVFFLHRWLDKNQRRWTRMFSVGVDGRDLYLFPMDEMVSHITWASPTELFSYLRWPDEGDGYYLIEDQTGRGTRYLADVLNSDGHPTLDQERGLILTDTYPDRFRNQYLVLADAATGRRTDLCRTHLPSFFKGEFQVDLHPRFHPIRPIACVDAAYHGVHTLLTLDFSEVLS